MLVLRGEYLLSKRTFLYVTADHIHNYGNLADAATTISPGSHASGWRLAALRHRRYPAHVLRPRGTHLERFEVRNPKARRSIRSLGFSHIEALG